jgi:hypothetical protein
MTTQIPPVQKVLYIDANRLHSVNNTNDNSSWEYQLNQGVKLPAGTEVQILQSYINYNGITGGSIEILEDVNEEIAYTYYKTQGSTFALTADKLTDENSGVAGGGQGKDGVFLYDCQKHRNVENMKTPLLKFEAPTGIYGYTSTDPSVKLSAIRAKIPAFSPFTNVDNPATIPADSYFPANVYDTYFKQFTQIQQGTFYSMPVNFDRVVDITIDVGGIGYVVGETITFTGGTTSLKTAFGYITEVDGAGTISKIGLVQTGEDYTGTPTLTINTAGGAGGVLIPVMGLARTVRTSGSGRNMVVGITSSGAENSQTVDIVSILQNGIGYRHGDEIYIDENLGDWNFFPVQHSANVVGTECTATLLFTTAMDIPSPGILTTSVGENIQYLRCADYQQNDYYDSPDEVVFIYDDNDKAPTFFLNRTQWGGAGIENNIDRIFRLYEYEIEIKQFGRPGDADPATPGANYRSIPEITYSPSAYLEPHLNTGEGEPEYRAIMNSSNQLEKVVYLPRCRDDITASNALTEFEISIDTDADISFDCPPGVLGVIGGNPDTQAFARYVGRNVTPLPNIEYEAYLNLARLRRAFGQSSGIKLGYEVVVIDVIGQYPDATVCSLLPVTDGAGTLGEVTVYNGYNKGGGVIMAVEVTTSGNGYKKGERYYVDPGDGRGTDQMTIIEILEINPINNVAIPAQTGNASSIYGTPEEITNGICDNLRNSMTRSTLFHGRSKVLVGDQMSQEQILSATDFRENFSTNPRVNYINNRTCDLPNLQTVGGTNDLIGYCEFDSDGKLIPFVDTKIISVPKGIYSIQEFTDLITNQLTNSKTKHGFLSESGFSKLIQPHSYEPAMFTGKEHNQAGRGVFVSMDVFNTLMDLNKNGTTIPDTYLWETFQKTYYYSFIRSFFPISKSPNRIVANSQVVIDGKSGFNEVSATNKLYSNTSVFDSVSNGVLLGSTDFAVNYNSTTSTFELQFLHSPFRSPEYDKFGNSFANPAQVGALVRRVTNSINTQGITRQYLKQNGFSQKTSDAIITALESPLTRETGVMVHNFSLNLCEEKEPTLFVNPQFATFEDFFSNESEAQLTWRNSLFFRLGFSYSQLNSITNKETVTYYNQTAVTCYGITTNQKLDSSIATSISSLNAINITNKANPSTGSTEPPQQVFNLTRPNIPRVPVFNEAEVAIQPTKDFTKDNTNFFAGAVYDSSFTLFIQTDGAHLTAKSLPVLIRDGYFILSSNVVDGYRDSIKKGENIPLLGVVPKSNWQSQDFTSIQFSEITHVISNPKVINSVIIDVYNPDLTRPILRPDSTVMLKITLPTTLEDLPSADLPKTKDDKK